MRRFILATVVVVGTIIFPTTVEAKTSKEVTRVASRSKMHPKLEKVLQPFWHIPKAIMEEWYKVNICEMGGTWHSQGPIYSGGLGIRNINWIAYGGLKFAPNAGLATPEEQVYIARKIEGSNYVPDQNGCGEGW